MTLNDDEFPETHEITLILHKLKDHPELFNEQLMPLIEPALKKIAQRHMGRERAESTLQPTALVNEAYMRLVKSRQDWQNRAHFLASASKVMRLVLIDEARKRRAAKRGANPIFVVEVDLPEPKGVSLEYLLALDTALEELATRDSLKAQIIHLKFFGGLTTEEIAHVLNVSLSTVKEHDRLARAMLKRKVSGK